MGVSSDHHDYAELTANLNVINFQEDVHLHSFQGYTPW